MFNARARGGGGGRCDAQQPRWPHYAVDGRDSDSGDSSSSSDSSDDDSDEDDYVSKLGFVVHF